MHSFTDRTGRAWNLEITVAALKRVRDLAKVDLCQIGEGVEAKLDDLALLGEVLFALVEPQAKPVGVALEGFLAALDGAAMGAAVEAFWGELACFFRPCLPLAGSLIELAAKIARKTREEQAAAAAAASISGGASTGSQAQSALTPTP